MGKDYKKIEIGGKRFKLHRVLMSGYLGRKLYSDEVVHHKDGDIHNNGIDNLELTNLENHSSFHCAGSKKPRKEGYIQHNTICEEKRLEILNLWKSGVHNYSKISKIVKLSDFCVKRYISKAINNGELQ